MGKRARKRNAGATDEQILSELVGQEPTDKPLVTVGDFDAPDTTENDQAQPEDAPKVELPEGNEQPVVNEGQKKEEPELKYTSGAAWDVDPTNTSLSASPTQGAGSDVSEKLEKIARSNEQIEGLLASIQSTLSEGLELRI